MMRELEVTEMQTIKLTEMAMIQMQMIETRETAKMDEGDRPKDGDAGGHGILIMLEY